MVLVVPMYEEDSHAAGSTTTPRRSSTPTASTWASTARPTSPTSKGFWEKFYFRPGNLGYPVFETAVGRGRASTSATTATSPRAPGLSGLNGAEMVLIPSATSRGLSEYLWRIEQPSATRSPTATSWAPSTGSASSPTSGEDDFYGQSYFCDPRGQLIGARRQSAHDEELLIRDMDLDLVHEVRQTWQFYRDRRPEMYDELVEL